MYPPPSAHAWRSMWQWQALPRLGIQLGAALATRILRPRPRPQLFLKLLHHLLQVLSRLALAQQVSPELLAVGLRVLQLRLQVLNLKGMLRSGVPRQHAPLRPRQVPSIQPSGLCLPLFHQNVHRVAQMPRLGGAPVLPEQCGLHLHPTLFKSPRGNQTALQMWTAVPESPREGSLCSGAVAAPGRLVEHPRLWKTGPSTQAQFAGPGCGPSPKIFKLRVLGL